MFVFVHFSYLRKFHQLHVTYTHSHTMLACSFRAFVRMDAMQLNRNIHLFIYYVIYSAFSLHPPHAEPHSSSIYLRNVQLVKCVHNGNWN